MNWITFFLIAAAVLVIGVRTKKELVFGIAAVMAIVLGYKFGSLLLMR